MILKSIVFWFLLKTICPGEFTSVDDKTPAEISLNGKGENEREKLEIKKHETGNIVTQVEFEAHSSDFTVSSNKNENLEHNVQDSQKSNDEKVVNDTSVQIGNVTALNVTDINGTLPYIVCNFDKEVAENIEVELVNAARLVQILRGEASITHRKTKAECAVLLFFARYCPFSSMAAPHFNALPRAFPKIKIAAVDVVKYPSFNTQYGIVGVPTVMIFHNGRPAAKFNDSEYSLETFAKFITKHTGYEPVGKLFVMSSDFSGPVSSVLVKETDYYLDFTTVFINLCGLYYFSQSSWWRWIVETVQNTWREAEAQHEHAE